MARAVKVFEKQRTSLRDKTIMSLSFSHLNAGEMPRGGNKMYKGCRYFLLLAAFIMGLGVLGGANEVGAAEVTKVSIAMPRQRRVEGHRLPHSGHGGSLRRADDQQFDGGHVLGY